MGREPQTDAPDRELWRRSRTIDTVEDQASRYLDLAAYADGRLDPDERERVAALLADDRDAAGDVAAARTLGRTIRHPAPPETVVARASAIVGGARWKARWKPGVVPANRPRPRLGAVIEWGGLAAAIVVAGWLGFTMGVDTSRVMVEERPPARDGVLQDLLGPSAGVMPDLTGT